MKEKESLLTEKEAKPEQSTNDEERRVKATLRGRVAEEPGPPS